LKPTIALRKAEAGFKPEGCDFDFNKMQEEECHREQISAHTAAAFYSRALCARLIVPRWPSVGLLEILVFSSAPRLDSRVKGGV
jgi:hypothetical protein